MRLLSYLSSAVHSFIKGEDGAGTAAYGAALAFAMLGAGLIAGSLLF
jgi:hypothetical protein